MIICYPFDVRKTCLRLTLTDLYELDNWPRTRRLIQSVTDLRKGDLTGCRLLDLGCAHGLYALNFARSGATTVGIDGRSAWISTADAARRDHGIDNATFYVDDVRNISVEKYGNFDIILCLGLLYHLEANDAIYLMGQISRMCNDFCIIDTQIALTCDETRTIGQRTYSGWTYREHPEGATPDEKASNLGASLHDDFSFWFSRSSLLNVMQDAGFTSVLEVRNPLDHMYLNGVFKMHEDVITLAAFRGDPVDDLLFQPADVRLPERWPESSENHVLERPWTRPKVGHDESTGLKISDAPQGDVISEVPSDRRPWWRRIRSEK